MTADQRFERYVAQLSDADALILHKIVCRRAAAIYGPMFRERQQANYRLSMPRQRTARMAQ